MMYEVHGLVGPTVFGGDVLCKVMRDFRRLNTPASNAGRYRLIAHIEGETFELIPQGGHTHGHRVFCAACHAEGKEQR